MWIVLLKRPKREYMYVVPAEEVWLVKLIWLSLYRCCQTVRPVLEYAFPVWHTNLSRYLSDSIERIQRRALKSIFLINRMQKC